MDLPLGRLLGEGVGAVLGLVLDRGTSPISPCSRRWLNQSMYSVTLKPLWPSTSPLARDRHFPAKAAAVRAAWTAYQEASGRPATPAPGWSDRPDPSTA